MADWRTVRFDESYVEKLDTEIVPLCDALNAAGFVTVASCCGHGVDWPRVWFEHSTDERIERLARFVLARTEGDFRPFAASFQKEVLLEGYLWLIELRLNNVYRDTPAATGLAQAVAALAKVTALVGDWSRTSGRSRPARAARATGPVCEACTTSPAPGKDLCTEHAGAWKAWKAEYGA